MPDDPEAERLKYMKTAQVYEVTATSKLLAGGHVSIEITGDPGIIAGLMDDRSIAHLVRTVARPFIP